MKKSKQNKKNEQNFAWSFVIVCFLLSGAVLLNMVSTERKQVAQKSDNVINEGQDKEKKVVIQDNKYQYNSIELSYVLENQKNVVYITKNGVKKVLLSEVIYDAPGGSEPKFYKTDKPNIALLESGLGDMGSIIKEYYYIDLLSERIFSVINKNTSMSVNGVKLSFDISDDCGTGADRVAGRAYLSNLLVDGGVKHTFDPKIELTCVNPDGFGSIYESEPTFNFKSADLDLGKVYFSVPQGSFLFDISDKSITKDALWSLYTNTKYGFQFQYPKDWEVQQDNDGSIYLTSNLSWPQEGKAFIIRETEKSLAKFIDDYNKSDILADGTSLSTIFEHKDYSIADVRADLLKGSTAIGVTSNIIFLTHNNRNYVIDFNDQSTNHLQVLKSFKFIE